MTITKRFETLQNTLERDRRARKINRGCRSREEGESVERITVLTLKRHLHLGDPRSGRWISQEEERRQADRGLCNSNPADWATRQRVDKCRWEKIGGDSRPRDGQDNGMFRAGPPLRSQARDTARQRTAQGNSDVNIGPQDPPGATFGTQFACQLGGDRDRSLDKVGLRVPPSRKPDLPFVAPFVSNISNLFECHYERIKNGYLRVT